MKVSHLFILKLMILIKKIYLMYLYQNTKKNEVMIVNVEKEKAKISYLEK